MGFADLPLLSQIKGRLTWLDERQRVIAQNVANFDTPGYVSRDLQLPTDFAAVSESRMAARMRPSRPLRRLRASRSMTPMTATS